MLKFLLLCNKTCVIPDKNVCLNQLCYTKQWAKNAFSWTWYMEIQGKFSKNRNRILGNYRSQILLIELIVVILFLPILNLKSAFYKRDVKSQIQWLYSCQK